MEKALKVQSGPEVVLLGFFCLFFSLLLKLYPSIAVVAEVGGGDPTFAQAEWQEGSLLLLGCSREE